MNLSTKLRKQGIEVNEGGRRSATGTHKQHIKKRWTFGFDSKAREKTAVHTKKWTRSRKKEYCS